MVSQEIKRNTTIIEGICDTVSKSAYDEKRNGKKQRDLMLPAGKCYFSCHHESTWNSKQPAE